MIIHLGFVILANIEESLSHWIDCEHWRRECQSNTLPHSHSHSHSHKILRWLKIAVFHSILPDILKLESNSMQLTNQLLKERNTGQSAKHIFLPFQFFYIVWLNGIKQNILRSVECHIFSRSDIECLLRFLYAVERYEGRKKKQQRGWSPSLNRWCVLEDVQSLQPSGNRTNE